MWQAIAGPSRPVRTVSPPTRAEHEQGRELDALEVGGPKTTVDGEGRDPCRTAARRERRNRPRKNSSSANGRTDADDEDESDDAEPARARASGSAGSLETSSESTSLNQKIGK